MPSFDRPPADLHKTYPVPRPTPPAIDAHPRAGRLLFHAVAVGVMIHGFRGLDALARNYEIPQEYGGFFQYLTILGLFSTILGMLFACLSDLLPAVQWPRTIKRFFLLFSLPVEITISSIYWPLVLFAPALMFPPAPEHATTPEPSAVAAGDAPADLLFRIPLWMDLSMHALPALALVFDFFIFERRFRPPYSTLGAVALAGTFGTAYALWIEHAAVVNGKFPYPFLTLMQPAERVVMYVSSTAFATAVFWALNWAHRK
ncbi:hypothetical protein Q5752_002885 [Cryptotrichosporon argae]